MFGKIKKGLIALGLVLTISTCVYAEVILPPQWSEFCPAEYLTARPSAFSSAKTYWYNRRVQFESAINQSAAYTGNDLKSYYNQIRQAEVTKNQQWQAKIEQERQDLQTLQQMNATNSTFNTLNNLIDKIK